jgi:serine/threonine-protein kinase
VVLPFINLGPADEAYFAAGITEEITARLAANDRLRVIGSTSANTYRATNRTIAEIGTELGVDYVLEGSVRWQKSPGEPARVRITPQLVSTADGAHLWAHVYDEPLDEIFRVQSEVAQRVVEALGATVLAPQRRVDDAAPTRNLEAYQYYLRGIDYDRVGTVDARAARASLRMFEKAVELDPNFALAHAKLSRKHSRFYMFYYDRSVERLALAKRAVDRALELEPGLPEAHHALAAYYFLGGHDYDRALREFATVLASRPNDSEVFLGRGVLRVRQGKFPEALADHERAWQLDPRSPGVANQYAQVHDLLRQFTRAEALYDRAIELAPDWPVLYFWKTWLYLRQDGTTQRARAVLDEARTAGVADDMQVRFTRVSVELFDRRYDEAVSLLTTEAPDVIQGQARFVPRAQLLAQVYGLMGKPEPERAYYDSAQRYVARAIEAHPDDARLHGALGIAYAGLGRKEEAIRAGERGVELLPVNREAFQGYYRMLDLARIYMMVGEHDAAVDRLAYLLSIPGQLTVALLRADPTWDSLRSNPRFQRLVAGGM